MASSAEPEVCSGNRNTSIKFRQHPAEVRTNRINQNRIFDFILSSSRDRTLVLKMINLVRALVKAPKPGL